MGGYWRDKYYSTTLQSAASTVNDGDKNIRVVNSKYKSNVVK